MNIGYARVSTDEQDNGRQVAALEGAGCEVVYQEKESGGNDERPELARLMEGLQAGDVVIVHKLDRLGRRLEYLLKVTREISERGALFKSLTEPFDTGTIPGRVMFQLMGLFAEWERETIRERVRHGIAHAKAQGVRFGRPKKERGGDLARVLELEGQGLSRAQVCTALGWGMTKYYEVKKAQRQQATT